MNINLVMQRTFKSVLICILKPHLHTEATSECTDFNVRRLIRLCCSDA